MKIELLDYFEDLLKLSESVAEKIWNNSKDKIWDEV